MSALSPWWEARSEREQRLLLVLALVALPVLAWLLVVRPLKAARETAQANLATATAEIAIMHGLAPAIRASRTAPSGPLLPRVQAGLAAAELAASSLDPAGQGRVTLRIAAARAPVLLRLVAGYEAAGLVVISLSTSRNEDSSVSAVITLAEPDA